MKPRAWFVLFLAVIVLTGMLQASTILVGAPNPNPSPTEWPFNPLYRAVEFQLPSESLVSSIDVFLYGGDPASWLYNFSLQDSLSGGMTFASASFVGTGDSYNPEKRTMNVNANLGAGIYYLVGSWSTSTGLGGGGWANSDGAYVGNVTDGTWSSLDKSTWYLDNATRILQPSGQICGPLCLTAQFEVNGELVPEPGSIALFGTGLAVLAGLIRRTRK